VNDVDTSDSVTFSDGGTLPPGLSVDPFTGLITGTATVPGVYSVTITVMDTMGATNTFDFNWNVTNSSPVANPDATNVVEDSPTTTVSGDIRVNDADAEDPVSALVITQVNGIPAPGSVTGTYGTITFNTDGTYTYTLDNSDPETEALPAGLIASETFSYQVLDTGGAVAIGNLTVNVTGANDPPAAIDDALMTDEDAVSGGDVILNDLDGDTGDTLTVVELNGDATVIGVAVTLASGARVTLNADGTYVYDPNGAFDALPPGATAIDHFTYTITDSHSQTSTATVNVTISGVNDAPVAENDAETTKEETAITVDVLGNDSDAEADPLTVSIATPPSEGNAVVQLDGTILYTPDPGYVGIDRFDYTITDSQGGISTATVTITVESAFIYAFDSFNDFKEHEDEDEPHLYSEILLSKLIPALAPEPIIAGYAKPGTVLIGRLYHPDGSVMAETMTTVDQAGNWVLQFFGARTTPETFVIIEHVATESVALGSTNFRLTPDTYRSMQLNAQHEPAETMGTILSNTPFHSLNGEHGENVNPLTLLN
jgi:VCBS repeat-containing protein